MLAKRKKRKKKKRKKGQKKHWRWWSYVNPFWGWAWYFLGVVVVCLYELGELKCKQKHDLTPARGYGGGWGVEKVMKQENSFIEKGRHIMYIFWHFGTSALLIETWNFTTGV